MAKRKGKLDIIEDSLDGEIELAAIAESEKVHAEHKKESISAKVEAEEILAESAQSEKQHLEEERKPRSFKLQFFGRDYVEERFPKSVEFADRFAQEWVNEGDFSFIEVPNPRAKEVLVLSLQNIRAAEKAVEKKVEKTYAEYSEKLAPYAKEYSEKLAPYAKIAGKRVEKILSQVRR
jgi:hypothetical protein